MRKSRLLERLLLALALLPFVVVFALLATGMVRTYRSPTGSMQSLLQLRCHDGEGGSGQRRRREIELEVEAVQLERQLLVEAPREYFTIEK